jgi:hypothetical protein
VVAALDVQEVPDPFRDPLVAQDRRGWGEIDASPHTRRRRPASASPDRVATTTPAAPPTRGSAAGRRRVPGRPSAVPCRRGRHSGQHQEDRGGYPPLLESAGRQRPAGDNARDRDE